MHTPAPIELMNVCLLRDDANRMLVQDRTDPSWPVLCFPGGHVEIGETCADAVVREMQEETGLTVDPGKLTLLYSWKGQGFFRDVFLARMDFSLEQVVFQPGETDGAQWLPFEEWEKKAMDGHEPYLSPVPPGPHEFYKLLRNHLQK